MILRASFTGWILPLGPGGSFCPGAFCLAFIRPRLRCICRLLRATRLLPKRFTARGASDRDGQARLFRVAAQAGFGPGVGIWPFILCADLAMTVPAAEPSPTVKLLRFGVRVLRVSASTAAVVALLQQQWLAGALFGLAWLLILGAPLVIPQLEPGAANGGDVRTPEL